MHVHIVLCCGAKRVCLPTSYQNVGVISLIPTCLQSFIYTSKHLGKRVSQTCMCVIYGCSQPRELWLIDLIMFTLFLLWYEKGIVYQQIISKN